MATQLCALDPRAVSQFCFNIVVINGWLRQQEYFYSVSGIGILAQMIVSAWEALSPEVLDIAFLCSHTSWRPCEEEERKEHLGASFQQIIQVSVICYTKDLLTPKPATFGSSL